MRVVSLVPSVTETMSAWGIEPIACTQFCERPDLAHVGGTKNPDVDAIVALRPDFVVLDQQENRREDAEALRVAGLRLVVLDVRSVEELQHELSALATALRIDPQIDPLGDVPTPLDLRAFVPIWRRPWMTIGGRTYGSSVLARIGVGNVCADLDEDYPEVDLEWVRRQQPDLVLVPSEPYSFRDEHVRELGELAPAVRIDGQDLFWWGARTPAAIRRLRDRLASVVPDRPVELLAEDVEVADVAGGLLDHVDDHPTQRGLR